MNKNMKPMYFFAITFFLLLGFASMAAVAKNDNSGNSDDVKKENVKNESASKNNSDKPVKTNTKSADATVDLKNYKKADSTSGETNAKLHKEKIQEVTKNLDKVANQSEITGSDKVSKKIEAVVAEQVATQETSADAIEEVEERGKIRTFLIGVDYKNLGQLRSELVQNRNQIRNLTQVMSQIQNSADLELLQAQLTTLTQERERIKSVITSNQSAFSLFGWVSRFLNNYEETPINEVEEEKLIEEVKDAVEEAQEEAIPAVGTSPESETVTTGTETTTADTTTESDATTTDETPENDEVEAVLVP